MSDPGDFRAPHLRGADFLGVFAVLRRHGAFLMVQNRRVVGGRETLTWDLPGGQLEPGELLGEALARELREETGLEILGRPDFLFYQEGEKVLGGRRAYAWRSFFFAVHEVRGRLAAAGEVLDVRWVPGDELLQDPAIPYHTSFREWLAHGGTSFHCRWVE
ncbi:MAG: NUDIX hydrolase [Planctomycetes bacterium]|nr:NUDIX hydrolase [Planctomycetota bacterium]